MDQRLAVGVRGGGGGSSGTPPPPDSGDCRAECERRFFDCLLADELRGDTNPGRYFDRCRQKQSLCEQSCGPVDDRPTPVLKVFARPKKAGATTNGS